MPVNALETQSKSTEPAETHEHVWAVESRHLTSDGEVNYLRCVHCATRQMFLKSFAEESLLVRHDLR